MRVLGWLWPTKTVPVPDAPSEAWVRRMADLEDLHGGFPGVTGRMGRVALVGGDPPRWRLTPKWPTNSCLPCGFVTTWHPPLLWHIAIMVAGHPRAVCDFRHHWPEVERLRYLPSDPRLCFTCASYFTVEREPC